MHLHRRFTGPHSRRNPLPSSLRPANRSNLPIRNNPRSTGSLLLSSASAVASLGVKGRRLSAGQDLQHLCVEGFVVGGEEAVGVVGPGASGEVGYVAAGFGDEEGGGGVVPGGVAGADGDVQVACREPSPPDARASDRTDLPATLEDLQRAVLAGVVAAPIGSVRPDEGVLGLLWLRHAQGLRPPESRVTKGSPA